MRLLFDGQAFSMQRVGGISRLFSELFRVFHEHNYVEWDVAIDFPDNLYVQDLEKQFGPLTRYTKSFGGIAFKGKGRLFTAINSFNSKHPEHRQTFRLLHKGDIDVFHPTYYDDYFLSELRNIPFVITVYDMIHELFPDVVNDPLTSMRKRRLIKEASQIIAISENTKNDLIRLTDVDEGKIHVVPLASSIGPGRMISSMPERPDKYMLFVGQRGGYKNFGRLFRAVAPLMRRDKSLHLVCLGGKQPNGKFTLGENRLIDEEGLNDQVLLWAAGNDELVHWYRNALCLLFPSLYEGFGLPVLDAFSSNCPVACSNTSSLPEVGRDGAAYFRPESIESMRETIQRVLESEEWRTHLVERGRQRLASFSWLRTAKETIDVYHAALRGEKT